MPKFEVFHYNMREYDPSFYLVESAPRPQFPADYTRVATVECGELADVFALTNHIDRAWCANPGVECDDFTARGTSVGDVVVTENDDAMLCWSVGWKRLPDDMQSQPDGWVKLLARGIEPGMVLACAPDNPVEAVADHQHGVAISVEGEYARTRIFPEMTEVRVLV
tara:strand:- start:1001 stop:1498 length:498 start_codon:yes stop_codon:yes gene_type:complete